MDGGERARPRPLLRLLRATTVRAFRAGQDPSRGDHEDVAVGKLLLEFAREAGGLGLVWGQ